MATLGAIDAHNAVGSLVAMYTGIIADFQRERQMYQSRINSLQEEINRLLKRLNEEMLKGASAPPQP